MGLLHAETSATGGSPPPFTGRVNRPIRHRVSVVLHTISLAVLAVSFHQALAEEPAQRPSPALLQVLRAEGMPGTEPLLAQSGANESAAPYLAALVEKAAGVMRLVVVHRTGPGSFEVVARSAPIGGLRGANFGFGIESFRFNAPERLELALSAPAACARALHTHRFAPRRGTWLVTGLDLEMPHCTDGGLAQHWTESANYLSGTTRRTQLARSGAPRVTSTRGARQPFPLAQFPPPGPEAAYIEMQP